MFAKYCRVFHVSELPLFICSLSHKYPFNTSVFSVLLFNRWKFYILNILFSKYSFQINNCLRCSCFQNSLISLLEVANQPWITVCYTHHQWPLLSIARFGLWALDSDPLPYYLWSHTLERPSMTQRPWTQRLNGPTAGALNAESPKITFWKNRKKKVVTK